MARHVCRFRTLRCVALILLASVAVAVARAESDPIAERIIERCPHLSLIPGEVTSSAQPAELLHCSPMSTECHVVPRSAFCPTQFPERAKNKDGKTWLTRHLVVMNANRTILFNITQFEVQFKNRNTTSQIKGCTGDFNFLDRCIVSMSEDDAAVMLHMNGEGGQREQQINFSDPCSADLTDRLQLVLRLFDELPAPTAGRDHRVSLVTVPGTRGSVCALRR